jgi:serine/threonine protein kinase
MLTWCLGLSIPGYLQCSFLTDIKLLKIIAEGGFGSIILAEAKSSRLFKYGNIVVVKRARNEMSNDDVQAFLQELSLAEFFKFSEYVSRVIGYTVEPYSLIMKYYPLGSLADWVEQDPKRRKGVTICISFMQDISRGLQDLHQKGVMHNDIKIENILLDDRRDDNSKLLPKCVITDFGLCKIVSERILQVKTFKVAQVYGLSYFFASPERFENYHGVTGRFYSVEEQLSVDVYAAGMITYHLMSPIHSVYKTWIK